jgi:hypothetical protein
MPKENKTPKLTKLATNAAAVTIQLVRRNWDGWVSILYFYRLPVQRITILRDYQSPPRQLIVKPPETDSVCPVTKLASSELK